MKDSPPFPPQLREAGRHAPIAEHAHHRRHGRALLLLLLRERDLAAHDDTCRKKDGLQLGERRSRTFRGYREHMPNGLNRFESVLNRHPVKDAGWRKGPAQTDLTGRRARRAGRGGGPGVGAP